ncbi:MAG: phosphate regulon sensor histidine kinase PhoR [Thiotrichales bacterium]
MNSPWIYEVWRAAIIFGGLGLVGRFAGNTGLGFVLGMVLYIAIQLFSLIRFTRWFRSLRHGQPIEMAGVWGELVNLTYRQYQKSRKRKKRIQRLLKNFNQFSAALPDATVILGDRNEITWSNAMAEQYLGIHPRRDIGNTITNLIRMPDFREFLDAENFQESLSINSPVDSDIRLHFRLAEYGSRKKVLSARDVTRMYRLEMMRKDFVGNVSHELRTPLSVIQGYSELLQDDDALPDQHRQILNQVLAQSDRMQGLIDDLLTLNRLETTEPATHLYQAVDVGLLIERMINEAGLLPGAGELDFESDVQSDQGLFGHPEELHSAFMNLVTNATKYTPAGGSVILRWSIDAEGRARFEVEDSGEGIASEHLSRLSERFYRVDAGRSREKGGTGLGLAIVKHILTRHEARLQITSTIGQGSTFCCEFPKSAVVELSPQLVKTS